MSEIYNINTYQQKSYIYLEGDKKTFNFHIIKEGKVTIIKKHPVIGEKPNETLGPGDFFGVVGAMSQLPHMESAFSNTKVITISVNYKRLPELVQHNPALATKIIRSFAKKLRQFNDRDTEGDDTLLSEQENFTQLYNLAENYFMINRKRVASYMYKAYMYYFPKGHLADKVTQKLQQLDIKTPLVKKTGSTQRYDDGEIIFCENEPTKEVFILTKGRVKISKIIEKKEVQLYIMMPGDIFGEMSILENKSRSATATALEDCEVMVIKKENFEIMSQKQPQLMTRLISLLAERIWNANKLILNSYLPDLDTKILDMLLILYERSRTAKVPFKQFDFNVNFSDIIHMIGLDERIDKLEENFLKSHKFIKLDKNSLICTNIPSLESLVSARRAKIDTMEE